MRIFNKEERTGKESLYSESYVVDFYRQKNDGFWVRAKVTYYSTNKGAHKQVLNRFKREHKNVNITSVTYE